MRRAHGIRGELVIEALTDAPDAIFAPGRRVFAGTQNGALARDARELRVSRSSPFKGGWIVHFDGLADRTEAESWRDRYLLLPEGEVEPPAEGELFIHELVGMRVAHVDGSEIGDVLQVLELPQGLMLEVRRGRKKPTLLPFDDNTVVAVDEAARVITVDPVEGLID